MFPITLPTSPETIAFLSAETNEEGEYQADIQQARDYDEGKQFVALLPRLRQFLGGDTANDSEDFKRLRLNICRTVLASPVDRLIVAGFDTDEVQQERPAIDEQGQPTTKLIKPVAAWLWNIWQRNRMDAKQRRVHEATLRDSESFVIVDWDNNSKRPRFTPHVRFVDVSQSTGADVGEGCRAFYRNDDTDQDLLFVTKRWTEVLTLPTGTRQTRQRLTVYEPGRISKYSGFPGAWKRTWDGAVMQGVGGRLEARVDGKIITLDTFATEADASAYIQARIEQGNLPWPIPWLDKKGQPLGIPVAHFVSSAGMEAKEAWPIQNAINKIFVDLMTESDIAAFRIMVAFGWKPVDRNGNPIEWQPGTIIGAESKDGRLDVFDGGDLSRFMNAIEGLMTWAAMVTDTPVDRFIVTKQVSAEGSQKQADAPLLNKVRNRQSETGNGWNHAMYMAVRLENTYGKGGLDEQAFISTMWEPLESRDETAELDRAIKKKALGMPISLIGAELGLTPEQITLWEESEQAKRDEEAAQAEQRNAAFQNG